MLRISFDELELVGFDVDGVEMFDYQGQPFSGILEDKHKGVICAESEYKNGFKEGFQTSYHYPSGKIRSQIYKKHNCLDGVFKRWDEDGNLIEDAYYQQGVKIWGGLV